MNSVEISNTTPAFRKVAECLCRHALTGVYCGLAKRKGHQFHKPFKMTDPELAERSLAECRLKLGRLTRRDNIRKVTFSDLADAWLASKRPKLKRNSVECKRWSE